MWESDPVWELWFTVQVLSYRVGESARKGKEEGDERKRCEWLWSYPVILRFAFYIRKFKPFPDSSTWTEEDKGGRREMIVQKGNNGIRRYRRCTEVIFPRSTIFSKSLRADTGSGLHVPNSRFERSCYMDKSELCQTRYFLSRILMLWYERIYVMI